MPSLYVTVESCAPDGDAWRVQWRIANHGNTPLMLTSAWVPHGRFRGADGRVALHSVLVPGAQHRLSLRVGADEPPGTVVENAFLILQATGWRIFTRMRIEFNAAGEPRPVVEATTYQSIES